MTDATLTDAGGRKPQSLTDADARTKKRNAAEARFRGYGIAAILVGLFFLVVLTVSIVRSGVPAFTHTVVDVEFSISEAELADAESELFKTKAYSNLFIATLQSELQQRGVQVAFDEATIERLLGKVGGDLRTFYLENPGEIGETVRFELPASSRVDGYFNGRVTRDSIEDSRFLMKSDLDLVDVLYDAGIIKSAFNWNFITGADSGVDNPGGAGIGASVIGSFFMMLVVLVLSLPIGVAASIYLEEFAPQNRFTDLIEVNISNLAAVPSIVF
ncbi:MAG: DUF3333 domain-containing protein, partial [Pseudomonadota bacterium]